MAGQATAVRFDFLALVHGIDSTSVWTFRDDLDMVKRGMTSVPANRNRL